MSEPNSPSDTSTEHHRARLDLVLKAANLGTWEWHIPSGGISFNSRWCEMLGYAPDEIEPHVSTWEKGMHPDDRAAAFELLKAHLDGNTEDYVCDFRLRHKDGHWVWIHGCGQVFERDTNGAPLRACGTHQDITEEKTAMGLIEESRQRLANFNGILATLREVNQLINKEKNRPRLLREACRTLASRRGFHSAWIALIATDSGVVTETGSVGMDEALDALNAHLHAGALPACARRALGQEDPVVISDPATACSDCPLATHYAGRSALIQRLECDSQVYGVLSVSAPARFAGDIEERGLIHDLGGDLAFALKKADTEKQLDLAQFALENASDTIFWVGPDGRFVYVNRAACQQLGYSREALLALSVADIDPDFPADRWPQHWEEMKKKRVMRFESHHRTQTGRVFPVEIYGTLIERDKQAYLFAFVHDMTQRKATEQRIQHQLDELTRWYEAMLGRETRMIELKQEVNALLKASGQAPRYATADASTGGSA